MNIDCPSCGNNDFEIRDYPRIKDNPLNFSQILICRHCGLGKVATSIAQTELDSFYMKGNYWDEVTPTQEILIHYRNQCSERIKKIKKSLQLKSDLNILDIGSGHGLIGEEISKALSPRNINYYFIEPDESLSRKILSLNHPNLSIFRLDNLEHGKDLRFDVIFLNHVLEHVLDPLDSLKKIKELLSPNGKLYIEVPHFDCDYKNDVFPHTLFFTLESLAKLLKVSSLSTVNIETFGNLDTGPVRKLVNKVFIKLQTLLIKLNLHGPVRFIDGLIFGYGRMTPKGRWIFAIAENKSRLQTETN